MSLPTNRQDGDVIENEDINALASAINDHEDRLTSVESDSGTSGALGVPVFGSQAEALAWEADNPGKVALWFDGGAEPDPDPDPDPVSGNTYFTDFGGDTTGQAPAGWTVRWVPKTWEVVTDATATGGKSLRVNPGGPDRALLTWDAIDADPDRADVEIVFKSRTPNILARGVVRASGAVTAETGYYGASNSPTQLRNGVYVGGTLTMLAQSTDFTTTAGVWYITRVRIEGTALKTKVWAAADPEPAAWSLQETNAAVSAAGWVGIATRNTGDHDIDWVGVATGGGTAPMSE